MREANEPRSERSAAPTRTVPHRELAGDDGPAPISQRVRDVGERLGSSRPGRTAVLVFRNALEGDLLRAASAMAFDLFLAAIPLLALAGWAFGKLARDGSALTAVSLLIGLTPSTVRSLSEEHLARFDPATVAPLALVGSLWLGSSAAVTCMAVFESRCGSQPRSWWVRRLVAIGWLIGGTVLFGLGGALALAISGGPAPFLEALVTSEVAMTARQVVSLCLIGLLVVTLLAWFFRAGMVHPGVRRTVWPGAFLSAGLVAATSTAFSYYATRLASFALYYGSLAAVAVTLVWLWLVCTFILVGAELNRVLEQRG